MEQKQSEVRIYKSETEWKKSDFYTPHIKTVDAFVRQLQELYFIENPTYIGHDKPTVFQSNAFLEYSKTKESDAHFIFYPWHNIVVKSVSGAHYFQLTTNRNRDLITPSEQEVLYSAKIAVFGLSVGSNIAYSLVQSGISKEITIADYDELDTTNLNRLPGGLHQIGLNKTDVAARKIYENNPYTQIHQLNKGISDEVLETMLKAKQIDIIFEEIDNVALKLSVRRMARKYKVPVLMITDNADGVILHIERYDLGYDQFFGKEESYWTTKLSNIKSIADVGELILNDIIGGEKNVHPRVSDSVAKVLNKNLISWSQLGTAATLGGVVGTVSVKQIVSGEDKRKYVHACINPSDYI